jgi:sortase (surface protein transpeptidase)
VIRRSLLGAALACVVLAGCGTEFVSDPPREPMPASPADPELDGAPAVNPDPASVTIPKIGAHSTLVPLGLTDASELDVPPVTEPMQAGWYAGAKPDVDGDEYKPGALGPAVIAGHVDGVINGRKGQPGIFARLAELAPGDEVLVDRVDGSRLTFVVAQVQRFAKDEFPSLAVYGDTDKPELRLITCGGDFDYGSGHYVDNWVVFAELAP